MRSGRLPVLLRLALLLGVSLALSLVRPPALLLGGVLALAILAAFQRLSWGSLRLLAWATLLPLPGLALLFVLAGRETAGAWGAGLRWGFWRLVPYTLRVAGLMLANLLFLQATPLPELMGGLRRVLPARAALLLATLVRFLPTTLEEARRVLEAQRCRGLARRRLLRPSGLLSLAVPLFLAQVRRSRDLALSLEIRGYASPRRFSKEAP